MTGGGAAANARLRRALRDGDELGQKGGGWARMMRGGGGASGAMLRHRDEAASGC